MKYLRTYKIFESDQELEDEIYDILLPIKDYRSDGVFIYVDDSQISPPNNHVIIMIEVIYNKHNCEHLYFHEIKDTILHLINYMKSKGFKDFIYQDRNEERRFNFMNLEVKKNILPDDDSIVKDGRIYFKK